MNEQVEQSVSQQENVEQDTNNYIEAIKEIKANSVSKEAYNKLKDENKQLLDSLINGNQVTIQNDKEVTWDDIKNMRKKLADVDHPLSNLEYAQTAVELRDALLEKGEKDPFLPWGHNISPTDEDCIKADRVADVFKQCIEYAEGDNELFTNELQRRTNDAMPLKSAMKNKLKR